LGKLWAALGLSVTMVQIIGLPNQKIEEAQAHCRVWHPHHCTIEEVVDDTKKTIDRYGLSVANPSLIPVSGYLESLYQQGNNRWKGLPDDFKACYRKHYNFNLDNVRYATDVNTVHGSAIINLSDPKDRHWMLHELEHVRQYQAVGGVSAFLIKYVVQGAIQIGRNGSISIHDNIELEREADSKADRMIDISCSTPVSETSVSNSSQFSNSPIFDPEFYLMTYGDLRNAFGTNQGAARNHWLTYGIKEGRRSSPAFDVRYYLNLYPDLQNAFGTSNYSSAMDHWLTYGIKEGRRSSIVFDVKYYLNKYADLQNAFGTSNYSAAVNHWLTYGVSEGRQGSPDFDPKFYLLNNPDVANVYGANNYKGAIEHYLEYGKGEGRRGTP
jgi:hypothetical protein